MNVIPCVGCRLLVDRNHHFLHVSINLRHRLRLRRLVRILSLGKTNRQASQSRLLRGANRTSGHLISAKTGIGGASGLRCSKRVLIDSVRRKSSRWRMHWRNRYARPGRGGHRRIRGDSRSRGRAAFLELNDCGAPAIVDFCCARLVVNFQNLQVPNAFAFSKNMRHGSFGRLPLYRWFLDGKESLLLSKNRHDADQFNFCGRLLGLLPCRRRRRVLQGKKVAVNNRAVRVARRPRSDSGKASRRKP